MSPTGKKSEKIAEIRKLLKFLAKWVPGDGSPLEHLSDETKKHWQVEDSDMEAPFLSEATLYPLIGKEDARTVLAVLRKIAKAAGDERLF